MPFLRKGHHWANSSLKLPERPTPPPPQAARHLGIRGKLQATVWAVGRTPTSSLSGETNWKLAASKKHGAHRTPSLKMQGGPSFPPPSCPSQTEGHQTPSSGAAAATAQRQPIGPRASAGHKNSRLAHAESTEAADWPRVRGGGAPGSGLRVLAGALVQARPRPHILERSLLPEDSRKGRRGRLGGHMANLKCPLRSAPPFPSLG